MRKSVRLAPSLLHVKKMAGRKRISGVPAKITKYFCSEVANSSDSTMVGVSGCSTETEMSRPEENESSGSASSFESAPSIAANNTDSSESQSESVHDLGYIIQSSMGIAEVSRAVSELSDGQRYKLLKEHYRPRADFKFPSAMGVTDLFSTDGLKNTPGLCTAKLLMVGFASFVPCSRRIEKV